MGIEAVQSANTTEKRRRSPTELARIVAAGHGWGFTWDGSLVDGEGVTIAATIEVASRAMVSLGWIRATSHNFVHWKVVPHLTQSVSAADAIRAELVYSPKPDRVPEGGPSELIALLDLTDAELALLRQR